MGWTHDEHPGHEGYLVATEREANGTWHEVRYPDDQKRPVSSLLVACDCGWRSPRLVAPMGSMWFPFIVEIPERYRERAHELWRRHFDSLPDRPTLSAGDLHFEWPAG
ncbi:hypothetical protein [Sorangium sp. So ce693]|uniref:hypothetical protein n=1 Tax=Sorangium sp. So ce693 TaxID=3133318 RepID=UPI003F61A207